MAYSTPIFISIHAPRTGSDAGGQARRRNEHPISIHAPRTGSDAGGQARRRNEHPISIHAPRTGSDPTAARCDAQQVGFQSTLPARGATTALEAAERLGLFQSTLPARGATLVLRRLRLTNQFQSTLPARGATQPRVKALRFVRISIHAPRTGSDAAAPTEKQRALISIHAPRTGSDNCSTMGPRFPIDFNPRSPHGERLIMRCIVDWLETFQSTLPARGATCRVPDGRPRHPISIHAPRTGSDVLADRRRDHQAISIHAPRTGSDSFVDSLFNEARIFQSTLPARGATMRSPGAHRTLRISIHAPRTGSDCIHIPSRRFL